ncbi:hypothetical protein [Roseateles sp.]|uniref:hypothetical protein n=1 Tax=Roseateles sp. TaxID=1971397 RepID=UPI0031DF5BE7
MAPADRLGRALRTGLTGLSLCAVLAAAEAVPVAPPNPRPAAAVGIAPRGALFTPASASEASAPAGADEDSDEAFRARAEAEVLRRVGAGVRREDQRLWLPIAKGRPVVLDSRRADPSDPASPEVDFRLDGLSPDREFYVVRATLAAGSELLWISRADGTRYAMHGNVHPSPDGRHLVVTHASPGTEFNGVVIWRREEGRLVERYRFQPTPDQTAVSFRFLRWRDADTIELAQFAEVDPSTCGLGTLSATALLSRKGERWILRSASAPRCEP